MSNNNKKYIQFEKKLLNVSNTKLHRLYSKPALRKLGDLRTLTLGGSPGAGDSGGSTTECFPTGCL